MINPREFVKVVFIQTASSNPESQIFEYEKRYCDITLDLSLVATYCHYINQQGRIDPQVTEVVVQGSMLPIHIRISYNEFNTIMQA
jgi:hypothetical protein